MPREAKKPTPAMVRAARDALGAEGWSIPDDVIRAMLTAALTAEWRRVQLHQEMHRIMGTRDKVD